MLSLLSKLKAVEKAVAEMPESSSATNELKKRSEDSDGEWLKVSSQSNTSSTDVPVYETKVIPVPKSRLIWAKCAGFKSRGHAVYFPARLCDPTEILNHCTVETWPLPPNIVVVEYFNIPRSCVYQRIVLVKKSDIRPYYSPYKYKSRVGSILSDRQVQEDFEEDFQSETEASSDCMSPTVNICPNYSRWDPESMEQLRIRLSHDRRYGRTQGEKLFADMQRTAESFLSTSTGNLELSTIGETEVTEESYEYGNGECSSDAFGSERAPSPNISESSPSISESLKLIPRSGDDSPVARNSSSKHKGKEEMLSDQKKKKTKIVKTPLQVGNWIRIQDKVFKNIAQTVQITRINPNSKSDSVIEYKPTGSLSLSDHICLVNLDEKGKPTNQSNIHGLVSDFMLVEGKL